MILDRFRKVALFDALGDEDLARICTKAADVRLEPGDVLFREGEAGDQAFIITAGVMEVLKRTERGDVLIAVRGEDQIMGELALLEEMPRSATVRARTSVDLVSIPKAALDDLLATSPAAARTIFLSLVRRVRETNDQLRHQDRMMQQGVLTAGIAHELNNPAAAVQRSAEHLGDELSRLATTLTSGPVDQKVVDLLSELDQRPVVPLQPVERSDAEAAVEDWLDDQGVPEAWSLAPALVEAGVEVADLDRLAGTDLVTGVSFLAGAASVRRLARQIASGAHRLSELVNALRSYAFLDRAPEQQVDVVRGLEDTLTLFAHRTDDVRVVREFDPELPRITAQGAELNQVWTNLIHNACDALADTPEATLTLRASASAGKVVVEVEDNGPGIPPDVLPRIFDAFFTTKEPGQGTGLGLQISYRIVVLQHAGDLTVESRPGRTVFRVVLPVEPPSEPATERRPVVSEPCEHLESVDNTPTPSGGCPDCLATGDTWVHLRFCVECGKVGCCNDSKNQHAARHASTTGHPVIRSKEPDENWAWCFPHDMGIQLPESAGAG